VIVEDDHVLSFWKKLRPSSELSWLSSESPVAGVSVGNSILFGPAEQTGTLRTA
jgi:hypothetical protein